MRNFLVCLIAVGLFVGVSDITFAQKVSSSAAKTVQSKMEILTGKIVSVDTTKNVVKIQEKNGVEKTFNADSKQISSLKKNEWIKVTLKSGSNSAETINEVIKKHNKS